MDAGHNSSRKFPSYTTMELVQFVNEGRGTPEMLQEIEDRNAGRSMPFVTPQIGQSAYDMLRRTKRREC